MLVQFLNANPPQIHDNSTSNDREIARSVREAVRRADSTLLNNTSLSQWRDYLKFATMDLSTELQPLVLIKFDEDQSFRNQLKTIIEWEGQWQRKETERYIYYYRWEQPPPEIILEVQEAHFNEIAKLFNIEPAEKIPFRYDPRAQKSVVYPYEDLRGGIVSHQPIDLESAVLAIFHFVTQAPTAMLQPLTRIYGTFFQNPATSEAYYKKCLHDIEKKGYRSIAQLFDASQSGNHAENIGFSAYAFMYSLNNRFGPEKVGAFLAQIHREMTSEEFKTRFFETFAITLEKFEEPFFAQKTAKKL